MDEAADNNEYAKLIRTIPGFGNFSALVVASMIGNIDRFNSPEALCSYCGVVPSVRSSANKTYSACQKYLEKSILAVCHTADA